MSFVKLNKGKPKNPPRRKKVTKPQPWDSTISDLDAYKATPDEIAYRREAHKSKHAVSSHLPVGKFRQGKRNSPFKTNAQARKYAIMKEVLYDQKQLQDVLEKSDTMMAVVKDLFGDDPRRFAGFPTVTNAPNCEDDIERSLVRLPGDIKTRSEVLSESVMDGSALNEFQDSDSEEEQSTVPLMYQPKLNVQRFQQFIEAEEKNHTLSTISGQAGLSHLVSNVSQQPIIRGHAHSSQLPEQSALFSQRDGSFQTPKGNNNPNDESLEILRAPSSAINDTNKVNKTKRRVPRPEPPDHNTSSNFSLQDLRKVLQILEDEIAEYERVTGRRPPAERQRQETFSGYTLAIVDSVTKLTRYLKESELRLQVEVTIREQLTQDVVQFRALVDALTSDIIFTQEEFGKQAVEFQKFKKFTEEEFRKLKGQPVPELGPTKVTEEGDSDASMSHMTPPKSRHLPNNLPQNEHPVPPQFPFGDHLQPASSAVMLSPPVRRSRIDESNSNTDAVNNKQGSLIDIPDYLSNADSNNSGVQDDFTELPGLCTTSNTEVINQLATNVHMSLTGKPVQVLPGGIQHTFRQNNNSGNATTNPVNSVSVPRPTPLVQSNVGIPLPSETVQTSISQQMPQSFLEKNHPVSVSTRRDQPFHLPGPEDPGLLSHRSQESNSTDREFLASQIAALNRQHAEAQMRLQGLMLQKERAVETSAALQMSQPQQTAQQEQPLPDTTQPPQKQQLQYIQQQRLIALVQQQQQKIQDQQQQQQQPNGQRPKPYFPSHHTANGDIRSMRESVEIPGHHQPKQVGLPDYPVSPNISPISRRSEQMTNVYKSVDSQDISVTIPASRGIMVSLPTVDMDTSGGLSLSPRH